MRGERGNNGAAYRREGVTAAPRRPKWRSGGDAPSEGQRGRPGEGAPAARDPFLFRAQLGSTRALQPRACQRRVRGNVGLLDAIQPLAPIYLTQQEERGARWQPPPVPEGIRKQQAARCRAGECVSPQHRSVGWGEPGGCGLPQGVLAPLLGQNGESLPLEAEGALGLGRAAV